MKTCIYLLIILFSIKISANTEIVLNGDQKDLPVSSYSKDWKPLFNGQDFDNWIVFLGYRAKKEILPVTIKTQNVFTVENNEIHMYKNFSEDTIVPEGFIATQKEYGNYTLKLEFKWGGKKFAQRVNKKRNSGVMFLAQDTVGFWPTSVECQVMEGDVGDIYTQNHAWVTTTVDSFTIDPATQVKIPIFSPTGKPYQHGGAGSSRLNHIARNDNSEGWNTIEIIVKGNEATYFVNGKFTNHLWNVRYINPNNPDDTKPLLKGRIVLQAEGTEIYYRNIMIRED